LKFLEYASCDSPFACAAAPVIARKWVPIVVCHLLHGPKRFSELKRAIPHVSAKVLTENLDFMQNEQMLLREVRSGQQQVEVWYDLTERGRDLSTVIQAMNRWGEKWLRLPGSIDRVEDRTGNGKPEQGIGIPIATKW
jgi:DNA-binding HxlR family transcriptional regulator